MKNYYKLLCVALIATICFSSCKKDSDTGTGSTEEVGTGITVGGKTYLIAKIKYSGNNSYDTIAYDSKGRITKLTYYYNNASDGYTTYGYSGSNVTITSFSNNNKEDSKSVIAIGSNGYASSFVNTETYLNNGYTTNYKKTGNVTQNSDGYVTKVTSTTVISSTDPLASQSTETSTTDYTYTNGNLTKTVEAITEAGSSYSYTKTYEYYTDKNYSPAYNFEDIEFLLGKTSKNLLKKATETSSVAGSNPYVYDLTYTFNGPDGLPNTYTEVGNTTTITYITK